MKPLVAAQDHQRRRRGPYHHWTPEETARQLEAFARHRGSVDAFCRETGVPRSTLDLWRHQARQARAAADQSALPAAAAPTVFAGFARVELTPAVADETSGRIRIALRGMAGREACLSGVDSRTALQIVALVLGSELAIER